MKIKKQVLKPAVLIFFIIVLAVSFDGCMDQLKDDQVEKQTPNPTSTVLEQLKDDQVEKQTPNPTPIVSIRIKVNSSTWREAEEPYDIYGAIKEKLEEAGIEVAPVGSANYDYTLFVDYREEKGSRYTHGYGTDIECDLKLCNKSGSVLLTEYLTGSTPFRVETPPSLYQHALEDFKDELYVLDEIVAEAFEKRILISALEDEDWVVRANAALALGELGDKEAVEPLIRALGDEDYLVREQAAVALGKIGDQRAIEPLKRALEDDYEEVREAAREALDKLEVSPANIEVIALEITPNPVPLGEQATAEVRLKNSGESEGTYTVKLNVDQEVVGSKEIKLKGGEEVKTDFTIENNELGSFNVQTNGINQSMRVIDLARPETGTYVEGAKGSTYYGYLMVKNGLDVDTLVVFAHTTEPETAVTAVYIRANDSYMIWPGSGHFIVYFSSGTMWDDYSKEFTSRKTFKKFEENFDFNTYVYSITLHPVVGGTAETEELNEKEFPGLT